MGCWDLSEAMIEGNVIAYNSAFSAAAIDCSWESSPTIFNNLIFSNSAYYDTGIVCSIESSPTILNNTIVNNMPMEGEGGGITAQECSPVIVNCIFWGNGDDLLGCAASYCCIEDEDFGEGNIHDDPIFAMGPLGDCYLDPESPCVDAGRGSAGEAGLDTRTTQVDGTPDSGTVDMGFHYPVP